MKKLMGALVLALLTALLAGAAAQEEMRVYIAEGTLKRQTAERMIRLLGEEFPQGTWTAVYGEEGSDLRALVLSDRAPQLAICAPQEAMPWAKEGLLLALDGQSEELAQMQQEIVDACVQGETLYMMPLGTRCREMAVNTDLIYARGFGYLLDPLAHPAWYPMEFNQLLEEFAIRDTVAMDIWLDGEDGGAALEALVQAIGGGAMLSQDGEFASGTALTGLVWLRDMMQGGQIGIAGSRQEALARFLSGETAIFPDWTQEEAERSANAILEAEIDLVTESYPTPLGVPVRAFEVVGVSVFPGERSAQTLLALNAVQFLSGETQLIAGDQGLSRDDAFWLPPLSSMEGGSTLKKLLAQAVRDVLTGEESPQTAMQALSSTMEAVR